MRVAETAGRPIHIKIFDTQLEAETFLLEMAHLDETPTP